MDYKQIIIDSLSVLKLRDAAMPNGTFKVRAYDKVIKQLNALKKPITSVDDITAIEGIGEKIYKKIVEILETAIEIPKNILWILIVLGVVFWLIVLKGSMRLYLQMKSLSFAVNLAIL